MDSERKLDFLLCRDEDDRATESWRYVKPSRRLGRWKDSVMTLTRQVSAWEDEPV